MWRDPPPSTIPKNGITLKSKNNVFKEKKIRQNQIPWGTEQTNIVGKHNNFYFIYLLVDFR